MQNVVRTSVESTGDRILSKWEWIIKRCKELGLHESAKLAKKIEEILKELYENTITEWWLMDYPELNMKYNSTEDMIEKVFILKKVIGRNEYCVACVKSKNDCLICEFALYTGACYSPDSLFYKFVMTFKDEIYRKYGIEYLKRC